MSQPLEEYLTAAIEVDVDAESEREVTDPGRFVIDSDEKAEWALRKLRQYRTASSEAREKARRERERIDAWEQEVAERDEKSATFFEALLAEYHGQLLRDDPNAKTVKLISGTLRARKHPDSLVVDDEGKVITWYEADPDRPANLLRVKKSIDKAGFKATFKAHGEKLIDPQSGEVVPGVHVEQGAVSFSVDLGVVDES